MSPLIKDPNATLTFGFEWAGWLESGDSISASVWTVESGLNVVSTSFTTTRSLVRLSSGVVGKTYKARNHITTAHGDEDDRTLEIKIVER